MRHKFATTHVMTGESIGWISKQMGHKNPTFTFDHYGRFMIDEDMKKSIRIVLNTGFKLRGFLVIWSTFGQHISYSLSVATTCSGFEYRFSPHFSQGIQEIFQLDKFLQLCI